MSVARTRQFHGKCMSLISSLSSSPFSSSSQLLQDDAPEKQRGRNDQDVEGQLSRKCTEDHAQWTRILYYREEERKRTNLLLQLKFGIVSSTSSYIDL
jgi:hypothetical protein